MSEKATTSISVQEFVKAWKSGLTEAEEKGGGDHTVGSFWEGRTAVADLRRVGLLADAKLVRTNATGTSARRYFFESMVSEFIVYRDLQTSPLLNVADKLATWLSNEADKIHQRSLQHLGNVFILAELSECVDLLRNKCKAIRNLRWKLPLGIAGREMWKANTKMPVRKAQIDSRLEERLARLIWMWLDPHHTHLHLKTVARLVMFALISANEIDEDHRGDPIFKNSRNKVSVELIWEKLRKADKKRKRKRSPARNHDLQK
jgi:hypothetical protein